MKGRYFWFFLGTVIIFILLISLINWKLVKKDGGQDLGYEEIVIPDNSKYIPKDAELTIHWALSQDSLTEYIKRNSRKRKWKDKQSAIIELRDRVFLVFGIDYKKDFGDSINKQISLTLLHNQETNKTDWMIFIKEIKNDDESDFIETFVANKSNETNKTEIEKYKESIIHIIKYDSTNNKSQIALSRLNKNNLIVLASNSEVIKKGIDASEQEISNQMNDVNIIEAKEKLKKAFCLIISSPNILNNGLTTKKAINEKIFISLKAKRNKILWDGLFKAKDVYEGPYLPIVYNKEASEMLSKIGGNIQDYAIINQPSRVIRINNNDPISRIKNIFFTSLFNERNEYLPRLIIEEENKFAILIKEPSGWIIGVKKDTEALKKINQKLNEQGYKESTILEDSQELRIWAKDYIINENNEKKLIHEIAGLLKKDKEYNWWAENIEAMNEKESEISQTFEKYIVSRNTKDFNPLSQNLQLSQPSSKKIIKEWSLYQLAQSLIGKDLTEYIQDLEVNINDIDDLGNYTFKGNLTFKEDL